jgi:hypothetical protein
MASLATWSWQQQRLRATRSRNSPSRAACHWLSRAQIGSIGKVMEKTLAELGVHTCGELRDNLAAVFHCFTPHARCVLVQWRYGTS